MTDKEKKAFVDKHITDIYPQLQINITKVCGAGLQRWGDDLLSTALEFFLNKPLDVQYDSCKNNKAENFVTYIANFQLKSSTTKFWHVWRKHKQSHRELFLGSYDYKHESNEDYNDDAMLCIKEAMKDLNPFEKMIVEEKVLMGIRFKEIAERYDIPYTAISKQLKVTLKKIKEKCIHLR